MPPADPSTAPCRAAFRQRASGLIVETGCFHDLACLPGRGEADLDAWEAGFTDLAGRFHTREEAARLLGLCGHLESRSYFAGEETPTLEAGHRETWHGSDLRAAARGGGAPGRRPAQGAGDASGLAAA